MRIHRSFHNADFSTVFFSMHFRCFLVIVRRVYLTKKGEKLIGHTYTGLQNYTDTDICSTRQIKILILELRCNPTMNQLLHCMYLCFFFLTFFLYSFLPSFLQTFILFFWSLILVWLELILCLHEIGSSSMQFFPRFFPLLLPQADSLKSCSGQRPTSAVWSGGI